MSGDRTPRAQGDEASSASRAAPRVLLVDDEFSIVETLAEILSFEGFDVATAPDGQQALDVFRARHVDIVIVDYMMPALNGLQFCERMRALPDGARVPIILMSAAPLDRLPGPRLWNASLQKPFEAPRLIDLVARLLAADAREP